ncbi:MAG TPA: hypothetical protein VMD77_03740 [Candidatus Baltobacteraceae bacterium]|jgi:hypothetical protein|nr:hypothetical protein [Candidatus Baltobacteraceae bacterium]
MKRFLGLTILILGLSVPAHAQARASAFSSGTSLSGGGVSGAGGGGGMGGGLSGTVNFNVLPAIPPTSLPSSAISGTDNDFVPSTFLPYDKAIAAGQDVLDAEHKSVAEAAAENSRARKLKARADIIENAAGDAVITTP